MRKKYYLMHFPSKRIFDLPFNSIKKAIMAFNSAFRLIKRDWEFSFYELLRADEFVILEVSGKIRRLLMFNPKPEEKGKDKYGLAKANLIRYENISAKK